MNLLSACVETRDALHEVDAAFFHCFPVNALPIVP
jgi:hypothetical protein